MTTNKTPAKQAYERRAKRQAAAKTAYLAELAEANLEFTTAIQAERENRRATLIKLADEAGISRSNLQDLMRRHPPKTT